MSMSIYLVKLPATLAARIEAEPNLLNQVWREENVVDDDIAALDKENDKLLEDYLDLARIMDERPERFPWMRKALHGTGREIAFEYGYGPGFVVTAPEATQIAAGLAEECGWRPGDEVITIDHAIAAFYASAGSEARTVIGGVG
jgi:hypothetical protein